MLRPDLLLLGALALTTLALPVLASPPAPCPDGGAWHGRPPPDGDGYFCARPGPDGELQRHGWAVLYHPVSQAKIEECEYRDGVRDGRCTLYSDRGALRERGSYTRGVRTGAWWFWSLPTPHGRRESLTLPLGDPTAAAERRRDVEAFLLDLGAGAGEASALGEVLVEYVDRPGVARRQVCGEHLCVGPGRIPDEPIYVGLAPVTGQTERDRKLLAGYDAKARKRLRDEERASKAAAARAAAEQRRLDREAARAAAEEEVEADEGCCRYCSTGKPCGDSCIARSKTCHKGRGCACWAD